MRATDVLRGPTGTCSGQLRPVEDLAHETTRMLDIRLGPTALRRIWRNAGPDLYELVVDQEAVVGGHEVEIARVPCGHYRLFQVHRLGHREPEALGSMQRHVTVTCGHHAVLVLRRKVAVDDVHIGTPTGGLEQACMVACTTIGVDRLEHQDSAV